MYGGIEFLIVFCLPRILYSVYCIVYTVYCILYTVYCILFTVYCILCTVYYSPLLAPRRLQIQNIPCSLFVLHFFISALVVERQAENTLMITTRRWTCERPRIEPRLTGGDGALLRTSSLALNNRTALKSRWISKTIQLLTFLCLLASFHFAYSSSLTKTDVDEKEPQTAIVNWCHLCIHVRTALQKTNTAGDWSKGLSNLEITKLTSVSTQC